MTDTTQTTKIYDMKPWEIIKEHDFEITRVPGGWIMKVLGTFGTGVFVPFDREFLI